MTIFTFLVAILVVGILWWFVDLLPIDATFKKVARVLLLFALLLWLLNALGLIHHGPLAQSIG